MLRLFGAGLKGLRFGASVLKVEGLGDLGVMVEELRFAPHFWV